MDIPWWLQKEYMIIIACHRESPSWEVPGVGKCSGRIPEKSGKSAQNVFRDETGPDARSRAETRGKMIPGPARSLSDWCRGAPGPKNRCRASGLRKNYFRASPSHGGPAEASPLAGRPRRGVLRSRGGAAPAGPLGLHARGTIGESAAAALVGATA